MGNEILISVIAPVYSVASYIKKCIKSIQEQIYLKLEIIIIDDGSGKICEEIAQKDDRIQIVRQANLGVVTARGKGVEFASGKYLLFVDGDDWIEKTMFELLLKKYKMILRIYLGKFVMNLFKWIIGLR